jgi:hypothetical protein
MLHSVATPTCIYAIIVMTFEKFQGIPTIELNSDLQRVVEVRMYLITS